MQTTTNVEILHRIIETQSMLAQMSFDLDAFMNTLVERMLLLTPAAGAVIELVEGELLVYKAACGTIAPFINLRLNMGKSLSGLCVRDKVIKICVDTCDDPRVDLEACKKIGAVSMVVVPLFQNTDAIGVLKVVSGFKSAFSTSDVAVLQLMATFLGSALGQQIELNHRKKVEAELTSKNEEMAVIMAQLKENGEELRNKNIQVVETANRIDKFTSTLSHELRTPLTSINGALKLISGGRAGTVSNSADELIKIAHSETERLIRLVNDLLDLAKLAEGKFDFCMHDNFVTTLVASAINSVQCLVDERSIKIDLQITGDYVIECDRDRIIQALVNLLGNAVKFSENGSFVTIKVLDTADRTVRFEIIDEGCGISRDKLPKLFSRFQQAESSKFAESPGTGLGLAISKSIVEQHGGRIGVESSVGEGSIFWFELPM